MSRKHSALEKSLDVAFPHALSNEDLVDRVTGILAEKYNYTNANTFLASSLCCDEVNRDLERDFNRVYHSSCFTMGGLAGFPIGGVTSFAAMAHHIPDGGSCLIVYGPHVGINADGEVGTVERRGRKHSGACCGSACAAAELVTSVRAGKKSQVMPMPEDIMDISQHFVEQMLQPHSAQLKRAKAKNNLMAEVPRALYHENHKMMSRIVQQACGEVAGNGKIALLGGIQINTPPQYANRFLVLNFEIRDNTGAVISAKDNLMQSLTETIEWEV